MKKNVMMRVASIMLVLVLMSSSVISGTFAKYVTAANSGDQARVAKFGVTVAVAGSLFEQNYVRVEDGNTPGSTNLTVESSNGDDLVAPGTQNDNGMTFGITGIPEVKVRVDVTIDNTTREDVYLVAGDYLNYTTGNDLTDEFNLANNYHPILYTLSNGAGPIAGLENVNILVIEDWLENTLSGEYDANTDLSQIQGNNDGSYKLTWKWNFENGLDEADTLLGNLAAGLATEDTAKYNLNAQIDLKVTVTQVD